MFVKTTERAVGWTLYSRLPSTRARCRQLDVLSRNFFQPDACTGTRCYNFATKRDNVDDAVAYQACHTPKNGSITRTCLPSAVHVNTSPCPSCDRHYHDVNDHATRQRRPTACRRGDGSRYGSRQVRALQRRRADTGAGRVSDGGLWRRDTLAQLPGAHRAPSPPAGDCTPNSMALSWLTFPIVY